MCQTFFLDEQRILRQLEGLGPIGLQRESAPDAADRRLAQAARPGHRACAPVCCVARRTLQCHRDYALDLRVGDAPRGAGARLIKEAVEAPLQEPGAPPANCLPRHGQLLGDGPIARDRGAQQDDPRALGQRLGRLRSPPPAVQGIALLWREYDRRYRSSSPHRRPPFYTEYEADDCYVS